MCLIGTAEDLTKAKKALVSEYLIQHKINLVGIQETMMESFSYRIINKISITINFWIVKPSQGNSEGILIDINESFILYN
jgi:hypothetical protein